jgi:eukaryotic-like serine/threonine-protein kinase
MKQCPQCLKMFPPEKSFCPFDGLALRENRGRADHIGYIIDNKYQLDEKIGEGATGTIYKATHLQLQAPLAIKVMRRDLVDNPTAVERFRREAYAAMKIRHPNAIDVLDFGIATGDMVYVVMEFLSGVPLSERLRERGRLSFLEIDHIIQQVCSVLQVAHMRGIVHRDLKPDNIFLHIEDGQEIVKVVDFGIAKLLQVVDGMGAVNLTGVGSVIGTPHYISPEQCTARTVDARSDIYSLGIILYRMLSGKLPFEGPNSMAVIYKQVTEQPRPIYDVAPDVPAVLNAVVMRALDKDPDKRPPDVITFSRELSAAIRAITEQEFQKVFLNATDEDLDAALLLTLDVSRSSHESGPGKMLQDSDSASQFRSLTAERANTTDFASINEPTKSSTRELVSTALPSYLNGRFPECDIGSVVHTLIGLEVTGSLLFYTASDTARDIVRRRGSLDLPFPFCSLYLDHGNIERAKLGVRTGAEAFFQLLQMPIEGSYIFRPALLSDELKDSEPIIASGEDLWQEAISLKIELEEYIEIFPNMLAQIELLTDYFIWDDKATFALAEIIWNLLLHPDSDLAIIMAKSPCCNAKTYRVLTLLLSMGQIRLIEE